MRLNFPAATWPPVLKLISALGTLLLLGIGFAAYLAIPVPNGWTHRVGLVVAMLPVLTLPFCIFYMVRGYAVDQDSLYIKRLITSTRIPLQGLSNVWPQADVVKGSIRVCGNGGLFAFTGWFYSKRLGRYRIFGTDLKHAVVLTFPGRTIVVTPQNPHPFIENLRQHFPDIVVAPPKN